MVMSATKDNPKQAIYPGSSVRKQELGRWINKRDEAGIGRRIRFSDRGQYRSAELLAQNLLNKPVIKSRGFSQSLMGKEAAGGNTAQ
jgi:hypothetical protein